MSISPSSAAYSRTSKAGEGHELECPNLPTGPVLYPQPAKTPCLDFGWRFLVTSTAEFTARRHLQHQLAAIPTICDGCLPTLSANIHLLAGRCLQAVLSANSCTSLLHPLTYARRPILLATGIYEELTPMMATLSTRKGLTPRIPITTIPIADCPLDLHR
ncbi:hypothetical protein CDV31_004445 [Fusarium ambrosium]|uniref:Uncharacterized protein n=1 Tax=Fusarium ambrosium TaxID=131363 RepID=A0A428UQX3_9HYPO|nr:hypothetical protein CDV31_004445 [Fusarium ambrosium]